MGDWDLLKEIFWDDGRWKALLVMGAAIVLAIGLWIAGVT